MDPERRARLHLSLCRGVGPLRGRAWIRLFGSAERVLRGAKDALLAAGAPEAVAGAVFHPDSAASVDRELQRSEAEGIGFLFEGLGELPADLEAIDAPPLALTYRGRLELLAASRARAAVVGTRTPTPYGARQAERFGGELASSGVVVVSGFARGVDRAAHRAALAAGGDTIAVLGSGLRKPYPSDVPELLAAIEERGLVLSEMPIDTPASRGSFPRRNRILSGLSRSVVVIEAGLASGSLLTARWAADQGREVCALPGRVDSPMSAGCHELLREGARLVESPKELLRETLGLGGSSPASERSAARNASPLAAAVLEAAREGATLDEIADRTGSALEALFEVVLALEMSGELARGPDALYRLVSR
jgi:DNA processing protein